jgi:pimeloyl-ACP methyl ester carboxylesterase
MTMGVLRILIASACLMAASSTGLDAQERAAADPLPHFETSECPFDTTGIDVEGLRCGYLLVPENREKDNGRTLRLAVAIAEPSGATGDPVVLLPGGPGGGPLPGWIAGIRRWIPDDRTLVVFDPRGTGYSGPVMCPELTETQSAIAALDLSIEEERLLRRGSDLACRDALLRQGIDLGAYNSTTVALDLIDLRQAVGYAQWNLMSASYGVPFARAAMRLDPEGIRSAVLAIGNPPDLTDLLRRDVPFRARALDRVFQGCAAEAACRALYPDLEEAFYRVGASFRTEPLTVAVDPERFRSPTFTVNSQDYFAMIGGLLPLASEVPHIPALVRAFDERDVDVVRKVVERHYGGLSFANWSFGMANSVMCYDAHTPRSRAEWQEAAAPYPPELAEVVEWLQPCEDWHDERASEEERRPHRSTIPALVISGEFDPTSHPVVGEEQVRWLPNGHHVVIPGMGHVPTARSAACWGALIEQFVEDPAQRPDDSCTEALPEVRIGPDLPGWAQPPEPVAALLPVETTRAQDPAYPPPTWEPADCWFDTAAIDAGPIRCGYVAAPENRAKPDGRVILLAVAEANPISPDAPSRPVVLLHGGPGIASLTRGRGISLLLFNPIFQPCLSELITQFLDAPSRRPDDSCIAALTPRGISSGLPDWAKGER